jgi:hypothetical protein
MKKMGRTSIKIGKDRLQRIARKYQPTGRRNSGRPRIKWSIEPKEVFGPRP